MVYSKVLKYCKENNISVAAFERECDLTNGTVNGWKNGSDPSLSSLAKIVRTTGTTFESWIDVKEDEK